MTSIRDIDLERDAPAVVALVRESSPLMVVSPASWLHRVRSLPDRSRQRGWVAEERGRVVGNGWAFRSFVDGASAFCSVVVASSHRRQGLGRALWERVEEHVAALGAPRALTSFDESPAAVAFAASRGFRKARAETESVLDLSAFDERPPTHVDLRPLSRVDPRLAYEVDVEATRDMPSSEAFTSVSYEEWVGHVLEHPLLSAEGSFLAFVEGDAAALSLLIADCESGRSVNMFTGTRRAYRGRGLALALKRASIGWARANGIGQMTTRNDEMNAPMLAVNRRLGYRAAARRLEYLREGTASSQAPRAPAT